MRQHELPALISLMLNVSRAHIEDVIGHLASQTLLDVGQPVDLTRTDGAVDHLLLTSLSGKAVVYEVATPRDLHRLSLVELALTTRCGCIYAGGGKEISYREAERVYVLPKRLQIYDAFLGLDSQTLADLSCESLEILKKEAQQQRTCEVHNNLIAWPENSQTVVVHITGTYCA